MSGHGDKPKRSKISAGVLMYRRKSGKMEVFLVHPGGPFWAKKDEGAWTIPKGECADGEDLQPAALRELKEETGIEPTGELRPLGSVKQKGGKVVHAWAFEGDYDASQPVRSNTFTMEWPPRSGRQQEFPEIDRAAWFDLETAKRKLNPAQGEFVERLKSVVPSAVCCNQTA